MSGACAPNKRGRDNERPAHHDEEWTPLAASTESPHTETKTQHRQKKKKRWKLKEKLAKDMIRKLKKRSYVNGPKYMQKSNFLTKGLQIKARKDLGKRQNPKLGRV